MSWTSISPAPAVRSTRRAASHCWKRCAATAIASGLRHKREARTVWQNTPGSLAILPGKSCLVRLGGERMSATLAVTRHTHSGPRLRELQAASAALGGIGAARSSRGESRRFGTEEETTRKERPFGPALLAFLIATIAAFGFGEPVQAATKVTVGVLKFGTVSWVLDTIQKNRLD